MSELAVHIYNNFVVSFGYVYFFSVRVPADRIILFPITNFFNALYVYIRIFQTNICFTVDNVRQPIVTLLINITVFKRILIVLARKTF